jgi:hypothetical protein
MRSAAIEPRRVRIARASVAGLLGGIVGTAAMYATAAVELAAAGVPSSHWAAATEVAFGGTTGSVVGLTGAPLHLVHGVAIGLVVGLLAGAIRGPAADREVVGLGLGIGLLLWGGLLALDPATRATAGAGPPIVLAFLMHLVFGLVVAFGVARFGGRWAPPSEIGPAAP